MKDMKRKIKFRCWDDSRKKMIYKFSDKLNGKAYKLFINEEDGNLFCGNYLENGDWNEPTLMQFTGLHDKNGKEIYEGDIVTRYHLKGGICYHVDGFNEPLFNDINGIEVIGNVYQNPELL